MVAALAEKPAHLMHLVGWEQNVQVRPYETARAKFEMGILVDPDADAEEVIAQGRDAFFRSKALVFEQLGINAEVSDGVLMEVVQEALPGSEVIDVTVNREPASTSTADSPPYDPNSLRKPKGQMSALEKSQFKANTEWAVARLDSHPEEFYDNRDSKPTANHPDYKHKTSGIGVWLN